MKEFIENYNLQNLKISELYRPKYLSLNTFTDVMLFHTKIHIKPAKKVLLTWQNAALPIEVTSRRLGAPSVAPALQRPNLKTATLTACLTILTLN